MGGGWRHKHQCPCAESREGIADEVLGPGRIHIDQFWLLWHVQITSCYSSRSLCSLPCITLCYCLCAWKAFSLVAAALCCCLGCQPCRVSRVSSLAPGTAGTPELIMVPLCRDPLGIFPLSKFTPNLHKLHTELLSLPNLVEIDCLAESVWGKRQ